MCRKKRHPGGKETRTKKEMNLMLHKRLQRSPKKLTGHSSAYTFKQLEISVCPLHLSD